MEDSSKKVQVFFDRKILIERESSGHIADDASYGAVFLHGIISSDDDISVIREQERRQYTKKSRLSGSVGTNDTVDFALLYLEAHIVQCCHATVFFTEMMY